MALQLRLDTYCVLHLYMYYCCINGMFDTLPFLVCMHNNHMHYLFLLQMWSLVIFPQIISFIWMYVMYFLIRRLVTIHIENTGCFKMMDPPAWPHDWVSPWHTLDSHMRDHTTVAGTENGLAIPHMTVWHVLWRHLMMRPCWLGPSSWNTRTICNKLLR